MSTLREDEDKNKKFHFWLTLFRLRPESIKPPFPALSTFLPRAEIRRLKGCEYVYVNGKSLEIYINLWIFFTRVRALDGVAGV